MNVHPRLAAGAPDIAADVVAVGGMLEGGQYRIAVQGSADVGHQLLDALDQGRRRFVEVGDQPLQVLG
jgi:hypothetical protein